MADVPNELPVGLAGVSGALAGVALKEATEYGPVPWSEIAATRKMYEVPFVNPRTIAAVAEDVPSSNTVHVLPLFELYWML